MRAFTIYFLILFITVLHCAYSQVVINEVQSFTTGTEPEWVELFNPTSTDIPLTNLYLHDLSTSRVSVNDAIVPANGFAVFTKDTLALRQRRALPQSARLYQVNLPSLNNTTEAVVLRTKDSVTIDSMFVNIKWSVRGVSFERADITLPAFDSTNIFRSVNPDSATCGFENSVARKDIDAKLNLIGFDTLRQEIFVEISNPGRNTISGAVIRFVASAHSTSSTVQQLLQDIPSVTSSRVSISLDSLLRPLGYNGVVIITASVTHPQDKRHENDTLQLTSYSSYPKGTLLLNEIMFDPSAGNAEFIEIYNTSATAIDIGGYILRDASSSLFRIPTCVVPASGYAVIAFDTVFYQQFPELRGKPNVVAQKSSVTLNSDDDAIILRDPAARSQDSLVYASSWHIGDLANTKGISLEKLSATLSSAPRSSWTSSADKRGCTPAEPNSVAREIDKTNTKLIATPNPFSPRSTDAKRQTTIIQYTLPFLQARCFATIYDANGLKVTTLGNSEYSGSSGNFTWDGRNSEGFMLDAGAYVCVVEAIDLQSQQTHKSTLMLAIGE